MSYWRSPKTTKYYGKITFMKTSLMDCPNCGYFLEVEKRDGKFKCRYCGSLLSYNLKRDKLTVEIANDIRSKNNNNTSHFIVMECPGCKANLEIDKEHLLAYCPYCGKKLFYNMDGLSYVLTEKEKTKRADSNNSYKLEKMRIEHEEKRKDDVHNFRMTILYCLIFILFYVLLYLYMRFA